MNADIEKCPGCRTLKPWASQEQIDAWKEIDRLQAEEDHHEAQYREYLGRFLGNLRFRKQINHHVRKANEAQAKKKAIKVPRNT